MRTNKLTLLLVFPLILSGCLQKWVADYNADVANEIVEAAKKVDAYYAELIEVRDSTATLSDQQVTSFTAKYKAIDNLLYGLYLKNQSRPLNDQSTAISKSILENLWRKYKGDLTTNKALLPVNRQRFTRNFEALLKSETVKEDQR
ncbi:MAG: hypothetical protein KI790_08815 [Cyclobacteriaceae bacterium]|nr:hypothetical protein [Cyclobacteriaceae bacterium HetDA_MAG_MS6]